MSWPLTGVKGLSYNYHQSNICLTLIFKMLNGWIVIMLQI